MRRILPLIGCLAVFIGLVIYVQTSLNHDSDWVAIKTREIEAAWQNPEEAQALYMQLDQHWNSRETFWGTLLPHENLQEIAKEITRLGVALTNQDHEDATQASANINTIMKYLLQRNTLRWDHIF